MAETGKHTGNHAMSVQSMFGSPSEFRFAQKASGKATSLTYRLLPITLTMIYGKKKKQLDAGDPKSPKKELVTHRSKAVVVWAQSFYNMSGSIRIWCIEVKQILYT